MVVWVVGDATINGSETGTSFKQALYFKEIGFNLHDTMIYKSEGLTLNHNRYEQEHEYMFVFSKGRPRVFNPLMTACKYFNKDSDRVGQFVNHHNEPNKKLRSGKERNNIQAKKIKSNIWEYSTGYGKTTTDGYAFAHPAMFPEQLAHDHIISWSKEGDTVLDPMCGSGTTGKMAVIANRNFIGIEISPEYVEIARARITRARGIPCDIPKRVSDRELPLFNQQVA